MIKFEEIIASLAKDPTVDIEFTIDDLKFVARRNEATLKLILKVGTESRDGGSVVFKMPKELGLSVTDRTMLKSVEDGNTNKFLKLARDIGKATEKEYQEVVTMMTNPMEYVEELGEFFEKVVDLATENQALSVTRDESLQSVTAILQSRLSKEWTISDTIALPNKVISDVLEYIENEQNQWKSEKEQIDEQDEEEKNLDGGKKPKN